MINYPILELDDKSKLPAPDLVILWEDSSTDIVDSSDWGCISGITYRLTGGHYLQGFLIAK